MNDVDCRPGTFVVNSDGRVGMIGGRDGTDDRARIRVKYGADGPFYFHSHLALNPASREQVKLAGLTGVGGRYV